MPPLIIPPIIIPPLVKWSFAALGGAAVLRWAVKEVRRINDELDRVKAASTIDRGTREALPKLRRDPATGHYRVM
jgi:hypothetical protein